MHPAVREAGSYVGARHRRDRAVGWEGASSSGSARRLNRLAEVELNRLRLLEAELLAQPVDGVAEIHSTLSW